MDDHSIDSAQVMERVHYLCRIASYPQMPWKCMHSESGQFLSYKGIL